ncbi:MAG: MOSC domain-containing protein [Holophagaceae bacterium]
MAGTPRLVGLRVGRVRALGDAAAAEPLRRPWRSAILKEPAPGALRLTRLGLEGDEVADRKHHGGPDQAVLGYASEHYPDWRSEGLDAGPGAFGENLLFEGLLDSEVCIGDAWRVGGATLQVSHPRQPCGTLARRFGRGDVVARVWATARGGWYFRVLEEGVVAPEGEVVLLDRPNPGWTVARVLKAYWRAAERPDEARAAADVPLLTAHWPEKLRARAAGRE